MKHLIWFCAVFLLLGCAGNEREQPLTIASLRDRPAEKPEDLPVEHSLQKAISGYRDLLTEIPQTSLAPEVMRRLADLGIEQSEIAQAQIGETGITLEQANLQSAASQREAIALYNRVLREHPGHPANEKILYQLARVYEQQGDSDNLLRTLTSLTQNYPESTYYAEAQFRRGELLFSRRAYSDAEQAYAQVLQVGETSIFYEQSLYKHGWSLFKQNRYESSLDSFLALLDRKLGQSDDPLAGMAALGAAEREQLEDTLRVISLTFSYQDGAESLAEYLQARDKRNYEDVLYQRLAEHYLEQERFNDAAETFEAYAEANQLETRAPLFLVRVIEAYEKGGFPNQVLAAKKTFAERYGFNSAYWQTHNPAEVPEVVQQLRENVDSLAKHYHASAQRSKKAEDYAEAVQWYRAYLRDFSAAENAAESNFLLAEILFESKDYASAASEYERAAYEYPNHAKSAEAGYAALLAYSEQQKQAPEQEKSTWQRRSIDSSLRFAERFPEHPQAAAVLTYSSEQLYALGELDAAETAARQVLNNHQGTAAMQRTAWTVVAHSNFDREDYLEAESAYAEVLKRTAKDDPKRADLNDRLAAAVYKQGEAARTAGDQQTAATHFLRVAEVAPTSSIRATAEYDAAAALINAKDWQGSARVLEDFRKRYPEHPQQFDVTQKLALVYLESGESAKAAAELERIEQASEDPEQRRAALLKAAELYEQTQQLDKAIASQQRFVTVFPEPVEPAIEARLKIAELYKAKGDLQQHQHWMREIMIADGKAGQARTDRTRLLAARAAMVLADPWRQRYRAQRLQVPLDKSLAEKKKSMDQTLKAYTQAADYGIQEITTEATFQIADVYYDFSRALYDSERPKNLSAEELEQYDILLEEQAYPFEEKAIEVHEINAKRVVDGVYDDWVQQSFERLRELLPARYRKSEFSETYVETIR